ncbi:MAG: pilus assembly protein [Pseudomonadota bacterium]
MNTSSRTAHVRAARPSRLAPLIACIATVLGLPVNAAVNFPNTPMQTNNGVPPNIWFILDDSGSMGSNFMPDSVPATTPTNISSQAYTRNTIYYNPTRAYRGWQRSDGSYMDDMPYTGAYSSNTHASGGTTNLSASVQTFYVPLPAITDFADARQYTRFRFLTDGTAQACTWNAIANSFNLCAAVTTFTWPGGIVRNVAQEKQNFANWYSYHRTRSKVAKAGASYAFNDTSIFNADNEYRVGYTTIWAGGNGLTNQTFRIPVGTNNGLFTGTNRDTWFARLFDSGASSTTPLIPALNRAGQYFEETGNTGPWGPQANGSQYECRQNFSILTTDGYWNNGAVAHGNVDGTDGSAITRPDGPAYTYVAADPFRDAWSNTLADVAMYYWKRDLRPEAQMTNTVPASTSNPAFWQHMVTFGISIGLKGTLDVAATNTRVRNNQSVAWPNPMDAENDERIDDLFHAAVNGRGSFVAASNPTEFADGLGDALRAIAARKGSGSNATVTGTSTAAGTKVFQAKYYSAKWYGELQAYAVTVNGVDTTNPLWSATIPSGVRSNIYTHNGSTGTTFPTAAQTLALTADVANYLRGDRSKEQPNGPLRERTSLLGTIVDSSPVYVNNNSAPAAASVLVGANDGMLHAFNANNGALRFSYVPRGINFADLKKYSDPDFGHDFFVDGALVTSTSRELAGKTILVGALGRGGKGVFALDVTDPTAFNASKVLWDRTGELDIDMGQVIGKPLIAKLNNGDTAVLVPNGLNSTGQNASTEDSEAVLFVYNLETGAELARLSTGVRGNNGLSSPRGWDEDGNGTVDIVYAGDFQGNVWKFDLRDAQENQWDVDKRLYRPVSSAQPITGGVTIAVDPATDKRWVFFGTGRLLTTADIVDLTRQSWYGVIDDESSSTAVQRVDLTARNIAQFDAGTRNRAFEPYAALPANSKGWYIELDLPPANTLEGERMVGDQQVVKNALIAASIVPSTNNPCLPGRGFINAVDAFTGTSLQTGLFDANRNNQFGDSGDKMGGDAVGSIDLGVGMVTDPALLDKLLIAGGSLATLASAPLDPTLYGGRISWREIIRR